MFRMVTFLRDPSSSSLFYSYRTKVSKQGHDKLKKKPCLNTSKLQITICKLINTLYKKILWVVPMHDFFWNPYNNTIYILIQKC